MGLFIPNHKLLILAPPKAGSVFVLETIRFRLDELEIQCLDYASVGLPEHRPRYEWERALNAKGFSTNNLHVISWCRNPFSRVKSFFEFAQLDSDFSPWWHPEYAVERKGLLTQEQWFAETHDHGTDFNSWSSYYIASHHGMSESSVTEPTIYGTLENSELLFALIQDVCPALRPISFLGKKNDGNTLKREYGAKIVKSALVIDQAAIAAISHKWREEIIRFGYVPPGE